jgi:hypothetical protein
LIIHSILLTKISRHTAIKNYPALPLIQYNEKKDDYDFHYPDVFANYILSFPSKSFKSHAKFLGSEITTLNIEAASEGLIFLGDNDTPWLYRDHIYAPAKRGLKYLAENNIGKQFNGAIQVGMDETQTFIEHLAWLVRCNAVLPTIYFTDPGQSMIGNLCQYGNLHISTRSTDHDEKFQSILSKSRFERMFDGICDERFSKTGLIKGRDILV